MMGSEGRLTVHQRSRPQLRQISNELLSLYRNCPKKQCFFGSWKQHIRNYKTTGNSLKIDQKIIRISLWVDDLIMAKQTCHVTGFSHPTLCPPTTTKGHNLTLLLLSPANSQHFPLIHSFCFPSFRLIHPSHLRVSTVSFCLHSRHIFFLSGSLTSLSSWVT